ncbi:Glycosyl transferase family 2 [Sphingomonas gellani]|uniref:Glycosyl transferase family 2 n=1 Tax=Sphingomonas gellani TaxID=1166340 RepID=A0A1H8I3P0_9SPHN|nr:glycosyltransferase [Sphingomonas gellani]SEN62942.1 Glycosyl transferase family 2 [Sphingomonas gellani]
MSNTQTNHAPLVSIALFAYNQERYVEAAVNAALEQDYPNLEIVLSDDRSTDRTFDIIKQMVAQYSGPHRVRARQSKKNAGTLRHVLEVARETQGEFLVLATGDDIQLPDRTRVLMDAWQKRGSCAFSTAWNVVDDNGNLLEKHVRPEASGNIVWKYFEDKRDRRFMSGPTAAYDPKFLKSLPLPKNKVFHEDTVFTFILHAAGLDICYTDIPTVEYRIHDKSYSNRKFEKNTVQDIKDREKAFSAYARDAAAYLDYIICDVLPELSKNQGVSETIDLKFMKDRLRHLTIEGSWIELSFTGRLKTLAKARSLSEVKTMLPRLVGLDTLASLKSLIRIR